MERQAISRAEPRLRSSVGRVSQPASISAYADDRPDAVTLRKLSDAMHDSPRVAAQRKLIGTMAASTAQRAAIPGGRQAGIAQRSVDPDFPTYHAAANPGVQPTIPEMKTFFDKFVVNEAARLREFPIEDDLLTAMDNAVLYATLFFLNSREPAEVEAKLNAAVTATNAAAASWDTQKDDAREALTTEAELRGAAAPSDDDLERVERQRRQGAMHYVGTTKEMTLRGVQSNQEGEAILTALDTGLRAVLGGNLGQVGVRGSAVTGTRTRNQEPFEQGVEPAQTASDASDLDFFFTSPWLEQRIRQTQNLLPQDRRINAGGTMNAQYLARWLNLGAAQNGYADSANLLAALTQFENTTRGLIGRKSDVTFAGGNAAAGIANDPGTLIR